MEILTNLATAFGLSTSAGLNAYLPLLLVGLAARYTDLIELNDPWSVMTNEWVLLVLAVLLLVEMTADKIPVVDSINDGIQTLGRPVAGAILFAGSSGVIGEMNPVLAFIVGLLLAGTVHGVKTAARPAVTTFTAGTGNWLVSILEDVLSFITAVMAMFLPILMALVIVAALGWFFVFRRKRKMAAKSLTATAD